MTAAPGTRDWIAALAVCAVYLALALGIVERGGYEAQDFEAHHEFLQLTLDGRWYLRGLTNPPLLYLYTEAFVRLFGEPRGLALACASFAVYHAAALVLLWRCAARILPPAAALLTLALLATLPAFVTTSVVFAADALVFPSFILFCYLSLRLLERAAPAPWLLAGTAGAQIAGGVSKYSFLGLAPAAFVLGAVLAWRHRRRPIAAAGALLAVFVVPTSVNLAVMDRLDGKAGHHLRFNPPGGAITLRGLLWPYWRDLELFAAPLYFEPIVADGRQIRVTADGAPDVGARPGYRILVDNRYSYPALLNLAVHSDVMNVTRRRLMRGNAFTEWGATRPVNQIFQRISVVLGALLSLVAIVSVVMVAVSMIRTRTPPSPPLARVLLAVLLPALVFYALVAAMLPFVGNETYYAGYWLPRFVTSSIVVFGMIGAWAVWRVIRRPGLRAVVIGLVAAKVVAHLGVGLG